MDKPMTTPEDTELREKVADICREGHSAVAETRVINKLMKLINLHTEQAARRVALGEAFTADRNLGMYPDYHKMKVASLGRINYLESKEPLMRLINPTEREK